MASWTAAGVWMSASVRSKCSCQPGTPAKDADEQQHCARRSFPGLAGVAGQQGRSSAHGIPRVGLGRRGRAWFGDGRRVAAGAAGASRRGPGAAGRIRRFAARAARGPGARRPREGAGGKAADGLGRAQASRKPWRRTGFQHASARATGQPMPRAMHAGPARVSRPPRKELGGDLPAGGAMALRWPISSVRSLTLMRTGSQHEAARPWPPWP